MNVYNRFFQEKLLTRDEETTLAKRVAEGDWQAREVLIISNMRLVIKLAYAYKKCGFQIEDIVSEGTIGLIRAVEGYDLNFNTRFASYAGYWVSQAIRRHIKQHAHTIKLPSYLSTLAQNWQATKTKLTTPTYTPTTQEIAKELGYTKRQTENILAALVVLNIATATNIKDGYDLLGNIPAKEDETPDLTTIENVQEAMKRLAPREKIIIERFLKNQSLAEISKQIGLTRERVRQIQQTTIKQLREMLNVEKISA